MELVCNAQYLINSINVNGEPNKNFLQFGFDLFKFNGETNEFDKLKEKIYNILNVHDISLYVSSFSGIDRYFIESNNPIDHNKFLDIFINLIGFFAKSNIYLVSWKLNELFNYTIPNNFKEINEKLKSIKNLKLISLFDICNTVFDINTINSLTLDSAYLNVYDGNIDTLKQIKDSKWGSSYNEMTLRMQFEIMKHIMKEKKFNTISELYEYQNRPVLLKTMPFGKWMNYTFDYICKNDMNYFIWLKKQKTFCNSDKNLQFTIQHYLNQNV